MTEPAPATPDPVWARALIGVVLAWGAEVTIIRFSWGVPSVRDLILGAVGLVVVGVLPVLLVDRDPGLEPQPRRVAALAALGVLPYTVVAIGIGIPGALHAGLVAGAVAAVAVLAPPIAWAVWAVRTGRDPVPNRYLAVAWLCAVAGVSWFLEVGGLAVMFVWPCAAVWFLGAFSARKPVYLPLTLVLFAGVSQFPDASPNRRFPDGGPEIDAPDLVLITVDTLRADAPMEASAYLGDDTASFDAQASSTWTLPSMASILTGQPVAVHGATRRDDGTRTGIAPDVGTLAEALRGAGYHTAAVVGANGNLAGELGFDRGFDVFHDGLSRTRIGRPSSLWGAWGTGRPLAVQVLIALGLERRLPVWDASEVSRRARRLIERSGDRPLFLWVHFMDPHLPYLHADDLGLPGWRTAALMGGAALDGEDWRSEEGREALRRAYDNEVDHVDLGVMEVFTSYLRRPHVAVLTSDHGEELFEHGERGHGHALWQEVAAVPLHLHGLGVGPPRVVASHLDIAPTFLAAAGVTASLPGRDLRTANEEVPVVTRGLMKGTGRQDAHATRLGPFKGIFGGGDAALYDLRADPGERSPIDDPDRLQALGTVPPVRPSPTQGPGADAPLLEDLGYTDP